MKKLNILAAVALLTLSQITYAVPAKPGTITRRQPDGTFITLRLHGDEFYHWTTDEAGNVLRLNDEGFLVPGEMPERTAESIEMRRATNAGRMRQATSASNVSMTMGTRHIPVFLVAFKDVGFTVADSDNAVRQAFDDLLNQRGYSANGGTGSVNDFYRENSSYDEAAGTGFNPVFDVFAPVTMPKNMSSYVTASSYTGGPVKTMLQYACSQLNRSVDFSQYDVDSDGYIDMALLYFAGYNQAEGYTDYTGVPVIWPHQSTVSDNTSYDGKKLSRYFCTSELKGYEGTEMCGVGTTCHEFAHSLGLPDFYDTDYDTNGNAGGTYVYDTMCSGSYNNDGRTPPYFGAEERIMLGWMDSLDELPSSGSVTIPSVTENVAYKSSTSSANEYFLYECRPGTGWDAYVEPGLVIYHVDKSNNKVRISYTSSFSSSLYTSVTAANLWANWAGDVDYHNSINENGSHPCYYIIPSANQTSLDYGGGSETIVFPGRMGITSFVPVDWKKGSISYFIDGISYDPSSRTASLNVAASGKILSGRVMSTSGDPIEGAEVSVFSASSYASSALSPKAPSGMRVTLSTPSRALGSGASVIASAVTDANGHYSIDLSGTEETSFTVVAQAGGYITATRNFTVSTAPVHGRFVLVGVEENEADYIQKYTLNDDTGIYDGLLLGKGNSIIAAAKWSAEELIQYRGRRIDKISFYCWPDSVSVKDETKTIKAGGLSAIVDFGSTRKLKYDLEEFSNGWNTVDVRSENICIPSDQDVYIGYGIKSSASAYPLVFESDKPEEGGFMYSSYGSSASTWYSIGGYNLFIDVKLAPSEADMDYLGFSYIYNPGKGNYNAGDTFALRLIESNVRVPASVSWYFDDEPVSGDSIVLQETGVHEVKAAVILSSGKSKEIVLKINVN